MSADDTMAELLAQSLAAWTTDGTIERPGAGIFVVHANQDQIRIERAPPGLPFRWMVSTAGRRRGAMSLVGVLRQTRAALDPDHRGDRVRIALAPLAPP
jgi:hypothetical protein